MKYLKDMRKQIVLGTLGLIVLGTLGLPKAFAEEYQGVKLNECRILDEFDGDSGRKSITLRTAIAYANKANRTDQRCRHHIIIEAPIINLTKPLVIRIKNVVENGAPSTRQIPDQNAPDKVQLVPEYVIEGKGKDGQPVTLNADGMKVPSGADSTKHCAITFDETSNITLRNIRLEKVPAGLSGICFGNSAHSIHLDKVKMSTVYGGHGIVFAETSGNNKILPGSSIEHVQSLEGIGVLALGSSLQSFNQIIATSRKVSGVDENGLSLFADGETFDANFDGTEDPVDDVKLFRIMSEEFISSPRPIRIRINEIKKQGGPDSTIFRVKGELVTAASEAEICTTQERYSEADVTRIQIYAAQPSTQGGSDAKFYKYLMPRGTETGGNGLDAFGSTKGTFRFLIDTQEAGNMIVMVPELAEHSIGGSGKVVVIGDKKSDCNGSVTDLGTDVQDIPTAAFWSFGECDGERQTGTGVRDPKSVDGEMDSDGDLLADVLEDSNGNCIPDEGDFSNWMDPDSDDDGILDSLELRGFDDKLYNFAFNPRPANVSRYEFCVLVDGKDPCNADSTLEILQGGQALSNAKDDDADEDGLFDYIEDRQRTLNPWASTTINIQGHEYGCSLDAKHRVRGIEWGVYRWNPNSPETDPVRHYYDNWTKGYRPSDGTLLVMAACKSKAVRTVGMGGGDFNAQMDEDQTDPYNIDSDGDDICDGSGTGCREFDMIGNPIGEMEKGDKCPRDFNLENDCSLRCIEGEDLYRVCNKTFSRQCADLYLNFDSLNNEEPLGLKDSDNDGTADLFEVPVYTSLYNICDSLDGDSIPDCVERMNPTCSPTLAGKGELNPFLNDTDGDGVSDDTDPDPFDGEINIIDDDNREILRTRLSIAQVPFVKCFVDRDDDGLKDCQEDLNGNDRYDGGEMSLETFLTKIDPWVIESDPLRKDSDSDGLNDMIEVATLKTNPNQKDTDNDGLWDRLEVKGDALDNYDDRSGQGCFALGATRISPGTSLDGVSLASIDNPALRFGTNPKSRDTDGDGIPDDVEVIGNIIGEIAFDELTAGLLQGFDLVSDPLSDDSDGDELNDLEEYGMDGVMSYPDSNPCDSNTDNDSIALDKDEKKGCATNPDSTCETNESGLLDSDSDGLPDSVEISLDGGNAALDTDGDGKPNINDRDSDNDGIFDGDEDFIGHDGNIQRNLGETDPRVSDTDLDGLDDGQELKLGTNPNKDDTDSDCIPDGVEVNFNEFSSFTGTDTNPTSPDSDGDGLCDGNNAQTNGGIAGDISCIRGEDVNCNGKVDMDDKNPDRFAETDPRNPDTDSDGILDKTEVCAGGRCDLAANIGHATLGAPSGCFSLAPVAPLGSSSMLYVYGLLLIVNRMVRRKFHK